MSSTIYFQKKYLKFSLVAALTILLSSCGAQQQNVYDTDGIYNTPATSNVETEVIEENNTPSDSYYKQYFDSKIETYSDLPSQGAVFTDIDAYYTEDSLDENGYIVTQERDVEQGYGAWGENTQAANVNIYMNGGFGFNNFWNRPYWWYGSGFGFYNNWCSPFIGGVGFGWGYPLYGYYGWGYPIHYGGFYNNFYNPFYGNPHFGYSYTRGRRNTDYYNGRIANSGRNFNYRDARSGRSIANTVASNRRASNPSATRNYNNTRATRYNRDNRVSRERRSSDFSSQRNSRFRPNSANTRSTRPNARGTRPATTRPSTRPSVRPSNRATRPSTFTPRSSRGTRSMSPSRGSMRSSGGTRGGGGRRSGRGGM